MSERRAKLKLSKEYLHQILELPFHVRIHGVEWDINTQCAVLHLIGPDLPEKCTVEEHFVPLTVSRQIVLR